MLLRDVKNPLTSLANVGETTARLFARMGVFNVGDLLALYPRGYDDRTAAIPFGEWHRARIHCAAVVVAHNWLNGKTRRTLCLLLSDGIMDLLCVAFGRDYMAKSFPVGTVVCVTAKVEMQRGILETSAFELIKMASSIQGAPLKEWQNAPLPDSGVQAIYPLTEGLKQKNVRKVVASALHSYALGVDDEVPAPLIEKYHLLHKKDALRLVHQPATIAEAETGRRTLVYEELFGMCCAIARRAYAHRGALPKVMAAGTGADTAEAADITGVVNAADAAAIVGWDVLGKVEQANHAKVDSTFFATALSPRQKQLLKSLPFPLTDDQMRVITDMDGDIDRGYQERTLPQVDKCPPVNIAGTTGVSPVVGDTTTAAVKSTPIPAATSAPHRPPFTMQRLLQGDVGSGKTLVALFVALRVIDWQGQCAFMAPTELLARQHADNAARLLEPFGVKAAFLSGNIKSNQRQRLLASLERGTIDIVIGTHALFSTGVHYHDLALAVIDEQHKFGVLQRQAIMEKGRKADDGTPSSPHLLMMSATPIPQSLALTVFGDLDVSTIHTMPAGRKPVATYLVREGNERNAYEAVRRELQSGRQAYFVYPAIEAGESNRKSAETAFEFLSQQVYPEYTCALLHSKIGEDEQVRTIADFRDGKVQVLAATTVIEVGVDVPNATCIVIEGANYFGMAQLHQLRGRVGRGAAQSYCFLIYSKKITEIGIQRMKSLRESTDGFHIAEEDLRLRGPGEVSGTMQSGMLRLSIADIERDIKVLQAARADAISYVAHELCDDTRPVFSGLLSLQKQ